jgi:hypothetical protein
VLIRLSAGPIGPPSTRQWRRDFSTKLSTGFSGAEPIAAAQLFYGMPKRLVRNQRVTAPASTTKIAITKFCGRVLIGHRML